MVAGWGGVLFNGMEQCAYFTYSPIRCLLHQVGARVYVSGSISGTYAQYTLCNADTVHPLPDNVVSSSPSLCLLLHLCVLLCTTPSPSTQLTLL